MISVIIPVYNSAKTIEDCVYSILRSAGADADFEIIIVNDGSNDQTDPICRQLSLNNDKIKYFAKGNGGVSSARNLGIEKASGDYISFVDADDSVSDDYLRILHKVAPSSDITFFGFNKCDGSSGACVEFLPDAVISTGDKSIENECIIADLLSNNAVNFFGFTWSKIFKSEIIRAYDIRFNTELKIKEDEIFTLEYCTHISTIQVLDRALYNYNIYENSLSHSKTKIRYDILTRDYHLYALTYKNKCLREILLELTVSYGLGEARDLKRNNGSKVDVISFILNQITPLVNGGCGVKASRWMPLVKMIGQPRLQAEVIYRLL